MKWLTIFFEGTILRADSLAEFASSGVYCQFDLFGIENSYYQFAEHIDWPSDAQRMDYIMRLIREEGRGDKVLVAHDIHTKHRLVSWKKSLKKSTILGGDFRFGYLGMMWNFFPRAFVSIQK